MLFRLLVKLAIRSFGLTDGDIAEVATALPNFVDVLLGYVCPANLCQTMVSSLPFISVRCTNLSHLETHFNTTSLSDDFKSVEENPRLRDSYVLPRCQLTELSVSHALLPIEEGDYGRMLAGFLDIFPSLYGIFGESANWDQSNLRLCE